jgi:hypothetical protein
MAVFRKTRNFLWLALLLLATRQANGQVVTTITNVNIFKQTTGNPPAFILEVIGTNLIWPEPPRVLVFPSAGTTVTVLNAAATLVRAAVSAPNNYAPTEVALSYSTQTLSKATDMTGCNTHDLVKAEYTYIASDQASKKYSWGVSKNFDVIQISIVNECPFPVLIPLAGIYLAGESHIHPLSLDHVTSIYSNYRQFKGGRAIYFNILQAATTIGSAIEPFLARGFTQGVSVFGGAFTQGSATVWKDLSAEQLQNLTSQSYQATEQVGSNGGSLKKFIFLPKAKNDTTVRDAFNCEKDKKKAAEKVQAQKKVQEKDRKKAAETCTVPNIKLEVIPILKPGP